LAEGEGGKGFYRPLIQPQKKKSGGLLGITRGSENPQKKEGGGGDPERKNRDMSSLGEMWEGKYQREKEEGESFLYIGEVIRQPLK